MRGFDISILLYVISNFSTNYLKANFIFCLTKSQAPLYERGWGCVFAVLRKCSCLSFVDCSCDFARVSGWSGSSRTAKHYKNTSKRATREAPFACVVFVCFCGRDYERKTRPVDLAADVEEGARPKNGFKKILKKTVTFCCFVHYYNEFCFRFKKFMC